jgi:hypothetical protein
VSESAEIAAADTAARVEEPETVRAPPITAAAEVARLVADKAPKPDRSPVRVALSLELTRLVKP